MQEPRHVFLLNVLVAMAKAPSSVRTCQIELCREGKGNPAAKSVPTDGNTDPALLSGREAAGMLVRSTSIGTALSGSVAVRNSGDMERTNLIEMLPGANVDPCRRWGNA